MTTTSELTETSKSITKSELIVKLIEHMQHTENLLSEKDIANAVNEILELICRSLARGERIEIRGFGSFCLHRWNERHARNPVTRETWRTKPTYAVHFKAGKKLRELVNARFLQEQQEDVEFVIEQSPEEAVEAVD